MQGTASRTPGSNVYRRTNKGFRIKKQALDRTPVNWCNGEMVDGDMV